MLEANQTVDSLST